MNIPSLPWTWTGGYPQRITNPQAVLIAEIFENPDLPATIAPLICESVNTRFGFQPYDERIDPEDFIEGEVV